MVLVFVVVAKLRQHHCSGASALVVDVVKTRYLDASDVFINVGGSNELMHGFLFALCGIMVFMGVRLLV